MKLHLALVLGLSALVAAGAACQEAPEIRSARLNRETVLSAGYSPGWVEAWGLSLLQGRRVKYFETTAKERLETLSADEAAEIDSFLHSAETTEAIAALEATSYKPDMSHWPEVAVYTRTKSVGYPVCPNGPPVAPPIKKLVDWLNNLGRKHFGKDWKGDIPTVTCHPGQDPF